MTEGYLLDVGLLLALYDPRHVHHGSARSWFESIHTWATTPVTESSFVRLLSNPTVMGEVVAPADAIAALDAIRHAPGHRFLVDDSSLAHPHITLTSLMGFRQVTDFHLLNLAVRAGLSLATFDARFARALTEEDRAHLTLVPV
ncbi:TA system VapC family ribonuclease toxin [Microbacterium sp.]|uniref:TA system VapC family ribonuclease toxin n=1 Tax=Microbacterium sp. TaxID=51671 RepID=UPI003C7407A0